ncbi:uncharacterized protein LOC126378146 [Pectinophora gossypiella]|uniref:uncharacterized protein LOC126378146 n=1 Tax=Pectinophora gossypiella TaxID=13191 RepID=UPI00214F3327|nr:uncharacterized protein LOC126378146 [Pectinophora gossypiella]
MDLSSILILFPMALSIHATPIMTRERLAQRNYHQQFCSSLLNFNNYFYSLEDQKNVTGIPADLSIHWKTGNIFFTLISEEMRMTLQVLHPSGEFETIKVAGLGQSTTVDNLNDIVYLATDNGVYKYKEDGSVELYSALGEDVMYIAVSSDGNTMYIATWPQNRVQKITNDGQKQETFSVIPNGHGLTLDTRNNIYFVATKTSYILKNGYTIPIKIKGLPSDKMTGVFVSRSDEVFAMDENSNLYTVDPENANAKHIGSFNVTGVNSFAMDSADNVLIGVKGAILKFNAYEKNPCKQYEMYEPIKSATIEKDESQPGKKGKRHNAKKRKPKRSPTTSTTEATEEDDEE